MTRGPAFRFQDLEVKVLGVALGGLLDARRGERHRAIRAAIVLEEVGRLPSPGLARAARTAAAAILEALGQPRALPGAATLRVVERAAPRTLRGSLAHAL